MQRTDFLHKYHHFQTVSELFDEVTVHWRSDAEQEIIPLLA